MADRRGFTLIEALAALAIVGLAGTAALAALGGELRTAQHARAATTAAALAEERLARIRLLAPRDLSPLADSLAHGGFPAPFEGYRWEARVAPDLNERDLYSATVRISGDADFTLATRLYRPGPVAPSPLSMEWRGGQGVRP
jgi:prepilin-type N-terminal cleavage/methylation domain-containing protein